MELFDTKYFSGKGPLFIGDRDALGAAINLIFVGDLSTAELSPDIERKSVIENVTGKGATGASWLGSTKYNLSLAMRSIKREHLTLALQGTGVAEAASTVTDEPHAVHLDKFAVMKYNKIDTVVITGSGGTPTYVADTDYKVHADEGMIEWLSGGTVTEDLAVLVDYGYAAQSHIKTSPNNLEKYLVFAGMNSADSDKMTRCEMYKVKLDPSVLSLLSDDATDMQIGGVLELDTLRAAGDQLFSWKLED